MIEQTPKNVFENQGNVWSNPNTRGDNAPPIRPPAEHRPTADARTQVGYSSTV